MYIESSSPRKKGDVAKLSSKYIQGFVTPRCFTFWYNMKGSTIGSISVDLVANSESINLWKLSGDQGAAWKYGTFPISPLSGGYKVSCFFRCLLVCLSVFLFLLPKSLTNEKTHYLKEERVYETKQTLSSLNNWSTRGLLSPLFPCAKELTYHLRSGS